MNQRKFAIIYTTKPYRHIHLLPVLPRQVLVGKLVMSAKYTDEECKEE